MRLEDCPTDEVLTAFHLGDLPEAELDLVREHQESCPRCESRARSLDDRTDAFIDDLRRTALAGPGPIEPAPRERLTLPDYEVDESPIGAGGMGVVYRARHIKLGRTVALKMIAGQSRAVSALFQIEAKAVAQLQHPNIVQIFEIGEHEGQPFLALELVEGGSLARRIEAGPRPPREAAETVRTLALAVDYAHRRGVVHCDLKPSNILITPDGVPKIADFGIARFLGSDDDCVRDGDVVGTPRYMAPEQASGIARDVGPASDIYSLGVILYEMLTGRTPHDSTTSDEALELVLGQDPMPPRQLRPKLSRDLETIVMACLRKEASRRYADARAFADDLGHFLAGDPILARPVGGAERAYIWTRRHPATSSVLALTTLWLATSGVLLWRYAVMLRRHDADLKTVTLPEATTRSSNQPVLVDQNADGTVRLRAFAAALYGGSAALEPRFGNIGYWHSTDDRAIWTFRIEHPGNFTLSLDYSNANGAAGNSFQVSIDDTTLRGQAAGTGAWSIYRSIPVGGVYLSAGVHRIEIRPFGQLSGALFDLRAITLTLR